MMKGRKAVPSVFVPFLILLSLALMSALPSSCSGSKDQITSYGLAVADLTVSHEKDGPSADPRVFYPGDQIYIRFSLSDYKLDSEGNLWIQEDLVMNDPGGTSVLTRQNLINDRVPPPKGTTNIPVNNTITLLDTFQPGMYTVQINVRDKIGGGAVYIESKVTVQPKQP
jgi:hypothetical protein